MSMTSTDTIAAIATAQGAGGIGIVRISGPKALELLERLFRLRKREDAIFRPWVLHRGHILDGQGTPVDDGLGVFMPGPKTFTGEDTAELHCHGGPVLLQTVLEACLHAGARLAERGEFTRRAFLHGRMDLTQAEAIAEMITAPSKEGARLANMRLSGVLGQRINALRETLEHLRANLCLAVDFPDDEVECLPQTEFLRIIQDVDTAAEKLLAGFERARCWREGVLVALAGPVNAGKSSLMNALLGRERAIVTDWPGTTRDFLEEQVNLNGLPARLVDTAGLRETDNPAEAQGIRMGRAMIDSADVVLLMIDGKTGVTAENKAFFETFGPEKTIVVWNKSDLASPPPDWYTSFFPEPAYMVVSARTGEGLEELAAVVRSLALARTNGEASEPDDAAPNVRQAQCLTELRKELHELKQAIALQVPYDLCAVRLESAVAALAELTGLDTPDEVLNRIFASFCIGK